MEAAANKVCSGLSFAASSSSLTAAAVVARMGALCGGAGSVRRRRRPSSFLLYSGSASVSAVFPPAQLEGPGGCIGVNRLAVAASSDGSGDGDLWGVVTSKQGKWKMESRSGSLLRRRRMEAADLQSGEHGDTPRPTCHRGSVPSFCDGPLNRFTTLLQLWCFGGPGFFGCSSPLPPAVLRRRRALKMMCTRASRDCIVI